MLDVEDMEIVRMEAILSRDQRTTSHRVLDSPLNNVKKINNTNNPGRNDTRRNLPSRTTIVESPKNVGQKDHRCPHANRTDNTNRLLLRSDNPRTVTESYDDRGIRSRHRNAYIAPTTCLRLGSLIVALLCAATVQGAPTMTLENRRLSSPPKWVNPCGLAAEDIEGDTEFVQLGDEQLLNQVVVQAKTALMHAQLFRDEYIRQTFNTDFADLHSTWKHSHYDWLPGLKEIPKHLGEQLDQEFLNKLEVRMLDTALLDAYEYMQKYAVGLEQVVWDQEDQRLEFRKEFKDTEFKLRTVLCELQVALVERMVPLRPDVTRDAMTSKYRAMSSSATYRNLRDWLIYRDYMNGLEYIVQVFEHLRRKLES